MAGRQPQSTLFPYTTLFRSHKSSSRPTAVREDAVSSTVRSSSWPTGRRLNSATLRDRKSTRLNSSHGYISYAVFCLKKKTTAGVVVTGGSSIMEGVPELAEA